MAYLAIINLEMKEDNVLNFLLCLGCLQKSSWEV
jgi:hypothetical protein